MGRLPMYHRRLDSRCANGEVVDRELARTSRHTVADNQLVSLAYTVADRADNV